MSVSKRLRYEVLRRDDHACRYCGAKAPDVKLTVDHVIPSALGGTDKPENLVTACADCNAGKSSSSPDAPIVANVEADALRWARAMELVTLRHAAERETIAAYVHGFGLYWEDHFPAEHAEWNYHRPPDWRQTVERFHAAGLSGDLAEIIETVMARTHVKNSGIWRYFCGFCWKLLEQRQDEARALIESGEVPDGPT